MSPRILAVSIAASLALTAPSASAQEVVSLAGKGENIEPIARVKMAGANEVELAGDWAFVSLDATDAGSGGLGIVNVADPQRPFVQSLWRASDAGIADASFGDVDLSADGNLAVVTNAHCDECAEGEVVRVALLDVSDKSRPRLVGKIVDDASMDYVHTSTLDGGVLHLGIFNAPTNVNTGACVAHVFWQAPDENRLTQAYYRTGAFVVDFEDPTAPRMLGWFVADGGAMYWSNKPHRGYLYATNMEGSLDILHCTGEGGARWPATAGPAEVQRAARQGVPYVPVTSSSSSDAGAGGGSQRSASTSSASRRR